MKWQPIETAPKDGTRIIGYGPEIEGDDIETYDEYDEFVGIVKWGCHSESWIDERATHTDHLTHWMPLPPAPETKS